MYDSESPRSIDAQKMRDFMVERGFECCDSEAAIARFHGLAQALIPCEIASRQTLTRVQERSRSTLYLLSENGASTGFLAFFAFSGEGEAAVRRNAFHGVRVNPDWVCEPSAETRMGYVWGFGGRSRAACFGVIRTGRVIRDRIFPHIAVFARAATPDGRKVMEPLGYQASSFDPSLYYSPPFSLAQVKGGANA